MDATNKKAAPMRAAFFRWVAGAGFEPTTFRLGACSRWRCAPFSLVLVEAARTRSVPQSRGLESAALGWSAVGTIVDALSDGCLARTVDSSSRRRDYRGTWHDR